MIQLVCVCVRVRGGERQEGARKGVDQMKGYCVNIIVAEVFKVFKVFEVFEVFEVFLFFFYLAF